MKRAVSTSFIFLMICALFLTLVGVLISEGMLKLLQTPPEIIGEASKYLRIYFSGLSFMFIYNTISAMLRGLGDSKTPLYFLIMASLLNVVLDIAFVAVFI